MRRLGPHRPTLAAATGNRNFLRLPVPSESRSAANGNNILSLPSVEQATLSSDVSVVNRMGMKCINLKASIEVKHTDEVAEVDYLFPSEEGSFVDKPLLLQSGSPRVRREEATLKASIEPEPTERSTNIPSTLAVVEVHRRSVRRRLDFSEDNTTSSMFARPAAFPTSNGWVRESLLGYREFGVMHSDRQTYRVAVASQGCSQNLAGNIKDGHQLRAQVQAAGTRGKSGYGKARAATVSAAGSSNGGRTEMRGAGNKGKRDNAKPSVDGGGPGRDQDGGGLDKQVAGRIANADVGGNVTDVSEVHATAAAAGVAEQDGHADVAAVQNGQKKRRRSQRAGRKCGGATVLTCSTVATVPAGGLTAGGIGVDGSDERRGGEGSAIAAEGKAEMERRGVGREAVDMSEEVGEGSEFAYGQPRAAMLAGGTAGRREPTEGESEVVGEGRGREELLLSARVVGGGAARGESGRGKSEVRGEGRNWEESGDGRRWYLLSMEEGEVDLHLTLGTGQTFRWVQTAENEYSGVVAHRLVTLRQATPLARVFAHVHPHPSIITSMAQGQLPQPKAVERKVGTRAASQEGNSHEAQGIGAAEGGGRSNMMVTAPAPLPAPEAAKRKAGSSVARGERSRAEAQGVEAADGGRGRLTGSHAAAAAASLEKEAEESTVVEQVEELLNARISMRELLQHFSQADTNFATLSTHLRGFRVLRQDPCECLFQFLCSSNNNIARIGQMVTSLSSLGRPVGCHAGRPFHSFPSVEELSEMSETELRSLGFGYRAPFVIGTAKMLLAKPGGPTAHLMSLRGRRWLEVEQQLCELPGVGPKVAACVALLSLDVHEAVPVDTHVWQLVQRNYPSLLSAKSLTKSSRTQLVAALEQVFGPMCGWAVNAMFVAELPSVRARFPLLAASHPPNKKSRAKKKKES